MTGIAHALPLLKRESCIHTAAENPEDGLNLQKKDRADLGGFPGLDAKNASRCPAMAFIRLWYTESWKTDLRVPFLSQAETATRLLLLLVVDISGAGQSLQFSLRPLSSPQSFWLSVTASVILKQYGLLGILWAYPIHCA